VPVRHDDPPRHLGRADDEAHRYDALLVQGFGGPEGPDDVLPFLERVTAGRGIPPGRLREVGAHYDLFGGVSPINAQTRALVGALRDEVARRGLGLPVHWGNRNAAPFLDDVVADLAGAGHRRVLTLPTATFASYSGCRQYREDLARAAMACGAAAPQFDRIRLAYNTPGFIRPMAVQLTAALAGVPAGRRGEATILFSAHSIPVAMADTCDYEAQLREASCLVMAAADLSGRAWDLVWQSRSGPPTVAWLEPDIADRLADLAAAGVRDVVVVPIGFVSDHMEVLFDLDVEARAVAGELGLHLVRARTVGVDPAYVGQLVDLVEERMAAAPTRPALGVRGPSHDVCAATCCPNLRHPGTPAAAQA